MSAHEYCKHDIRLIECAECPVSPDTPRPPVVDPYTGDETNAPTVDTPRPTVAEALEDAFVAFENVNKDDDVAYWAARDALLSAVRQEEAAKHQAVRTVAMECRKAIGDVALLLDANKEFEAYRLIAQTLDRFPLPEVPR